MLSFHFWPGLSLVTPTGSWEKGHVCYSTTSSGVAHFVNLFARLLGIFADLTPATMSLLMPRKFSFASVSSFS